MENLEWLVEDPEDVAVCALMVREFGPGADPEIYGKLACEVNVGPDGPGFEWSRLRAQDLEKRGFLIPSR